MGSACQEKDVILSLLIESYTNQCDSGGAKKTGDTRG